LVLASIAWLAQRVLPPAAASDQRTHRRPVTATPETARTEPSGSNQSIRSRGAAVPVSLVPTPVPTPVATPLPAPDEDGTGRKGRIWPMKIGTYSFTQSFGCVAQISGFYRTDPTCPADQPAVHFGIDLASDAGELFYAPAPGVVTEAGLDRATGLANTRLVVEHNGENAGFATEYLHWSASFVGVGDEVDEGQPLGRIGSVGYSTGPHLHFAVVDFDTDRYIDPVTWLPKKRATGAYRGTVPHAPKLTFDEVSEAVPDYADPAPPAVPQQQSPQQGTATKDAGTGDSSKQDTRARERRKDRHDAKRAEKKAARTARRAEILAAREAARAEQAAADKHDKRNSDASSNSTDRDRKDR